MTTMTDAYTWQGRELLGADGEKIGEIKQIYEDTRTGKPEWALVSAGLFGTRSHFVPLNSAQPSGEGVQVNVTKDQVKSAPGVQDVSHLTPGEEVSLFDHYGVPYGGDTVTSMGGAATPGKGQSADEPISEPDIEP